MFLKKRQIHFVGIGGIGMSGIAEVLLNLGHAVSGSDLRDSEVTRRLASLGARIHRGHAAEHVEEADVVVVSSAVGPDNCEVRAARERRIAVIQRAEMLAELMRLKLGVAISGAHGKTTVTSLTARVLHEAGLDPTVVNGGRLGSLGSSSRLGHGEWMVAEADESDRTFLKLSPVLAVATNLDEEHMESYSSMEDMAGAYQTYLDKVPFWGVAILCADDVWLRGLAPKLKRPVVRYALDNEAEVRASAIEVAGLATRFVLERHGRELGPVELPMPGRHNVLNALAAAAVGLELDVPFETIARALGGFEGTDRRFQTKGEARGVLVIDDYAHHPTEIRAVLRALKRHHGQRTVAVFQPHRYTRVSRLEQGFRACFGAADVVVATEIYAAGEQPIDGLDGRRLAEGIRSTGHDGVHFVADFEEVPERVVSLVRPGDVVITLGAGSVTRLGPLILDRLEKLPS